MRSFFDQFPSVGYVCAHRGARSIAPENTHMALDKARQCGADLLEIDVQLSADGELVLFHDRTFERTTDIATLSEFSSRTSWDPTKLTFSELEQLDAGSWFLQADPFGTIASGEVSPNEFSLVKQQKIPLLRDVLNDCRQYNFPVNIEIKDQMGTSADGDIVGKVVDLIKATDTEQLVLVSSFNHDYLRQVKKLNPFLGTAALVENSHPEDLLDYLADLGVAAYHPDQQITDDVLIKQLKDLGIRVNLWTVNDLERAQYFIDAGATFICTDWPQRLVERGHSP